MKSYIISVLSNTSKKRTPKLCILLNNEAEISGDE